MSRNLALAVACLCVVTGAFVFAAIKITIWIEKAKP